MCCIVYFHEPQVVSLEYCESSTWACPESLHHSVVSASLRGRRRAVVSNDQPASQCFQSHHGNLSFLLLTVTFQVWPCLTSRLRSVAARACSVPYRDLIVCHLCQLSLLESHGFDIPSTNIEFTRDFRNGSIEHFITSSQHVVHMNNGDTSDLFLLDKGRRIQGTRCESVIQK